MNEVKFPLEGPIEDWCLFEIYAQRTFEVNLGPVQVWLVAFAEKNKLEAKGGGLKAFLNTKKGPGGFFMIDNVFRLVVIPQEDAEPQLVLDGIGTVALHPDAIAYIREAREGYRTYDYFAGLMSKIVRPTPQQRNIVTP